MKQCKLGLRLKGFVWPMIIFNGPSTLLPLAGSSYKRLPRHSCTMHTVGYMQRPATSHVCLCIPLVVCFGGFTHWMQQLSDWQHCVGPLFCPDALFCWTKQLWSGQFCFYCGQRSAFRQRWLLSPSAADTFSYIGVTSRTTCFLWI